MLFSRMAAIGVGVLLCGSAAIAAPEAYQINLGPVARTDATRLLAVGRGTMDVVVNGNKLSLKGSFSGLGSAATDAHLCIGEGIGTQGTCSTQELTLTKDVKGDISGDVTLSAKELEALPMGRLYVQINSVKAPAPSGNLWGWILIAHEQVGQDVPQQGHWFLPQYDMPKSVEHGSTHPLQTNPNS